MAFFDSPSAAHVRIWLRHSNTYVFEWWANPLEFAIAIHFSTNYKESSHIAAAWGLSHTMNPSFRIVLGELVLENIHLIGGVTFPVVYLYATQLTREINMSVSKKLKASYQRTLGVAALCISSFLWAVPSAKADPISWVNSFSGYACKLDSGVVASSSISVRVNTAKNCQGAVAGYLHVCFVFNGVGLTCPHATNPARFSAVYPVSMKPALLEMLHASMVKGQLLEVMWLNNTLSYPHYEGPLKYGNRFVISAFQAP